MAKKTVAPKKTRKPVERRDSWASTVTGHGTNRDKRQSFVFYSPGTNWQENTDLWRGDDLAGRIVEAIPNEMMRQGWDLVVEEDDGKAIAEKVKGLLEDLCCDHKLWLGLCYERAYGGAGVLMGTGDLKIDMVEPLDLGDVTQLQYLETFEPRELQAHTWQNDPSKPGFGAPLTYRFNPTTRGGTPKGFGVEIHESRLLIFPGIQVSRRQVTTQAGWGDAVLSRCRDTLRDYQTAWAAAGVLATEFSISVWKIKGLAELLATDNDQAFKTRLEMMDLGKSTLRAAVIDAEGEDYGRQQTPVTGLPELLVQFGTRLAASADTPVSLLHGVSPAGMNATGEFDLRTWYDRVQAQRSRKLKPILEKLCKVAFAALNIPEPKNWYIRFPPMWQPTEKEIAEARLTQMQIDEKLIETQMFSATELREQRYGGREYSFETRAEKTVEPQMTPEYLAEQEELSRQKELENRPDLSGLLSVAEAVAGGKISRESGIAVLRLAYDLPASLAGDVAGDEPEQPPMPQLLPGQAPTEPIEEVPEPPTEEEPPVEEEDRLRSELRRRVPTADAGMPIRPLIFAALRLDGVDPSVVRSSGDRPLLRETDEYLAEYASARFLRRDAMSPAEFLRWTRQVEREEEEFLRWVEGVERRDRVDAFNAGQPRDQQGQWTSGGFGGARPVEKKKVVQSPEVAVHAKAARDHAKAAVAHAKVIRDKAKKDPTPENIAAAEKAETLSKAARAAARKAEKATTVAEAQKYASQAEAKMKANESAIGAAVKSPEPKPAESSDDLTFKAIDASTKAAGLNTPEAHLEAAKANAAAGLKTTEKMHKKKAEELAEELKLKKKTEEDDEDWIAHQEAGNSGMADFHAKEIAKLKAGPLTKESAKKQSQEAWTQGNNAQTKEELVAAASAHEAAAKAMKESGAGTGKMHMAESSKLVAKAIAKDQQKTKAAAEKAAGSVYGADGKLNPFTKGPKENYKYLETLKARGGGHVYSDKAAASARVSKRPIESIKGTDMGTNSDLAELKAERKKFKKNSSESELAAAAYYTTSIGAARLNAGARNDRKLAVEDELAMRHLDNAIARHRAPRDLVIHRAEDNSPHTDALVQSLESGTTTWVNKGYTSSSAGARAAFGGRVKFHFTVPKGHPMGPIQGHHDNEREILLPRNVKFQLTQPVYRKKEPGSYQEEIHIHATIVYDES